MHFLCHNRVYVCVFMKSLQPFSTLCDPKDCNHQSPEFMRFSRQEYWSGLPCPSPGDLPDPGIKPSSPALAGGFFTAEPPGNPIYFSAISDSQVFKIRSLQLPRQEGESVKKNKITLKSSKAAPGFSFLSFISDFLSAYMSYKVERTLERFLCPSLCHKIK